MTNRRTALTFAAAILVISSQVLAIAVAAAANTANCDIKIAAVLKTITNLYGTGTDNNGEKLFTENDKLDTLLVRLSSQSALLENSLKRSKEAGLTVAESKDHKLRLYSWDTLTGGTMHFFRTVAQYHSGAKLIGKDFQPYSSDQETSSYENIKTFNTKAGDTIYLIEGNGVGSSIDYSRSLFAYSLKNGQLHKVNFFKTPTQFLKEIKINIEQWTGDKSDTLADFAFADNDTTLKVPLINEKWHNTGKFLIYKFDGDKFVFKP